MSIEITKREYERKYKRINKPYLVKFRMRPRLDMEGMSSTDWDMVAVRNLGASGAFFLYNKDLGVNTSLDLKIDISTSTPTITCIGAVIRVKKYGDSPMLGIAVAFSEIDEEDQKLLNKAAEAGS